MRAALDRHHLLGIEPVVDPIGPVLHQLRARANQREYRDPWSSVAPRRSQRACLRSSVDFRTCRDRLPHRASVRCVGAEVPFNVWSVDVAHPPGELDCRPLFRPLTPEVAGLSQSFARPLAQKWAPERTASGRFSFPPDDDEEFRGRRGKRVNRRPATASHYFLRQTTIFGDFLCSLVAVRATKERSMLAQER